MKSGLNEMLLRARSGEYAVAAFNVLNHLTLSAVLEAAAQERSPIIIQTSVATVKALGPAALANMARRMIEAAPVPAVLHLDHCQDVGLCALCCDLGWDSVMFDSSHLPFEENIKTTQQVRRYARTKGVDVEGEVGIIAGTEDDISHEETSLAGYEETMRYIRETEVEAIAPAIGTAHGVYRGVPKINFELVQRLATNTPCPVVVHGGTGLEDATFRRLIELGAAKINISTALKQAYVDALRQYLAENSGTVNPLKLDRFVMERVVAMIVPFLKLFGSSGRA
jgi:fructose-bisphosphate aldolase class II